MIDNRDDNATFITSIPITGGRITQILGSILVIASIISGISAFAILTGNTPIVLTPQIVVNIAIINGLLVASLILIIAIELGRIWYARRKGRAAAGLHIRVIALFTIVTLIPAVVIAVIASLTLDQGLDKWFSKRTKAIVDFSLTVAQAYVNEHRDILQVDLLILGNELERIRPYYDFDRSRLQTFLDTQARQRGIPMLMLLDANGGEVMRAASPFKIENFAKPPIEAIQEAQDGNPVMIPPGNTNQVGGIIKLPSYGEVYLFITRTINPRIIQYFEAAKQNVVEYRSFFNVRYNVQIAFGLMFLGLALIVTLAAIWIGIGFSNRLVAPIRRLIHAADLVSQGNLYVQVPTRSAEGDLGRLGTTFNKMTVELRSQHDELITVNEQIDERRRFSEAVLAGVTAGVLGLDEHGKITLANRSAEYLLSAKRNELIGKNIITILPDLSNAVKAIHEEPDRIQQKQITISRNGNDYTIVARVTAETSERGEFGCVITMDDVTDLVVAQRNAAWADVARRIAHEIKNPLTPIQLSAERLRRKYGKVITQDKDIFEQCTGTIIRQVGDIGRMVDEFSSFARMPKPAFQINDFAAIIRETCFMMRVGNPDITINISVLDHKIAYRCDRRLISQALTNVIKNAVEAIEALPNDDRNHAHIDVILSENDNSFILDILDNGKGFPKQNRQKLLEPYMTTREKGTGLGLAIVRRIAEEHGGAIELMDAPKTDKRQHGACVRFILPKVIDTQLENDKRDIFAVKNQKDGEL